MLLHDATVLTRLPQAQGVSSQPLSGELPACTRSALGG